MGNMSTSRPRPTVAAHGTITKVDFLFLAVDAIYKLFYITQRRAFCTLWPEESSGPQSVDCSSSGKASQFWCCAMLRIFVGDEADPLRADLMKPYPIRQLDHNQRIYSYRLSRAWWVIETTFGILTSRFRVFHSAVFLHSCNRVCIVCDLFGEVSWLK